MVTEIATYKWITFSQLNMSLHNHPIYVCNNKSNELLGNVRWYVPWRQYCFFVADGAVILNHTCLADILDFINKVNHEKD